MPRALGLPINVTVALSVQLSVTLQQGANTVVLDNTDAAYIQIAIGKYRPNDFINLVDNAIRTWLFSAIAANSGAGWANVGTKFSKNITLTLAETSGMNNAKLTIAFTDPSATKSGLAAVFSAVTLNNSNQLWTLLGMAYQSDSTVGPATSFAAKFQSKYIFIVDRSEVDSGAKDRMHYSVPHKLDSGKVKRFKFGGQHTERQIDFVQQDESIAGPPLAFGRAYTTGTTSGVKDLLQYRSPALGGISLGPENPYFNTSYFTDGCLVKVQDTIIRGLYSSGAFGTSTIKLVTAMPTALSLTTINHTKRISELWAFYYFVMELGQFYLYDVDDFDNIIWISETYTLNDADDPNIFSERPDIGLRLFDVSFKLIAVDYDETTIVNIT